MRRTKQSRNRSNTRFTPTLRYSSERENNLVAAMTSVDRQQAFSGTKDAAPALRIDAGQLERYLDAQIASFAGPLTVRQFKGGQSNPTYLLETPGRRYVLRRKPPGKLLPPPHPLDPDYPLIIA